MCPLFVKTSVGEPVARVSDEGGFWRARRLLRQRRASHKTDRSRGQRKIQKREKPTVNTGDIHNATPPRVGKGVGIP